VRRLLFVVPRFGRGIVGGAETLVRGLATRAVAPGDEVTVATTCAVDHTTWRNELPAGEDAEDGVRVLRFAVGARNAKRYEALHGRLLHEKRLSYAQELEMMAQSVWSPDLQHHLEEHGTAYDRIIFAPYLFGTTFWGVQAHPERSMLLPCLHDEPDARMRCLQGPYGAVAGWIFNTPAEERLARRLFHVRAGGVVGMGFDPPEAPARTGFAERHGLGRYVVYAGRLERAKRVDVACEYVARFARERGIDLKIVLIGDGSYETPEGVREYVVRLGYVTEDEKRSALAEAIALVNPSELESLSLVLLEAWREGTPALVAAGSEVMVDHCRRSGGGLWFHDYREFATGLTTLLDGELRRSLAEAGEHYVAQDYAWPQVAAALSRAVEAPTRPTAADAPR
jgi:glycosyltransferase involved in cell wall biosynthesis